MAFRVIEGVLAVVGVMDVLSLMSVSEQFVGGGGLDRASGTAAGQALLAQYHWVVDVGLVTALSLGGLLYYLAFYRTRLIPRWLSGWVSSDFSYC